MQRQAITLCRIVLIRFLPLLCLMTEMLPYRLMAGDPAAGPVAVLIAADGVGQPLLGFGAEWDSRNYQTVGAADFARIRKRIEWMRLPIVRVMMMCRWCYLGDGKYQWDSPDMQMLRRNLDVCQQQHMQVILTDWGCDDAWMACPGIGHLEDPVHAEVIATYVDRLVRQEHYTCIRYLVLKNEPNNSISKQSNFDKTFTAWKQAVVQTNARLMQAGLHRQVVFMGPDAVFNEPWHRRAVEELNGVFGAYDIHHYPQQQEVRDGVIEAFCAKHWAIIPTKDPQGGAKPRLLAEAGIWSKGTTSSQNPLHESFVYGVDMADIAVQAARAGTQSVLAWMLDDNSHSSFTWGMWKSVADGLALKPWFYPWSLLSRTFPAGTRVLPSTGATPGLRVLAGRWRATEAPGVDGWTVCLVNRQSAACQVHLAIAKGPKVEVSRYLYAQDTARADKDGFPVPFERALRDLSDSQIECPANSVTFLTTMAP